TDRVDLLAGTSTGGIICLGLAAGVETEDLVRLYQVHSKSIFRESFADRLSGGLDEHLRANYKAEPLNRLLENIFGDRRLGDLHDSPQFGGRGKEVMVCAFDLHPD